MDSIGEQLSKSRQAQGLSIADVAARLRIRSKFVEALEEQNWSAVGEFVYVRGFLKNYAELLGLDPQPFLVHLRNSYQPDALVHNTNATTSQSYHLQRTAPAHSAAWFPWVMGSLTAIAGVLVVLVAIGVFGLLSPANRHNVVNQPPVQNAALATPGASKPDENGALSSNEFNAQGVNLRLQLTQRSWLSVIVDGKRVVYETLPAGTIREFHGAHEITLRAGNAGGVMANIDGKDLGKLGAAGQVEDRVFAVKTPSDQVNGVHE